MKRTLSLFLIPSLAACSDYAMREGDAAFDTGPGGSWDNDGGDGASAGDGGAGETEPEVEDSFFAMSPAATTAYLFVANPDRDTVTRVAVPSLQVITAEVGDRPIAVATTSDYRKAVTFNEAADSVSVIDAETLTVHEIGVRGNFNSMSLSPDGRWVICWHDPNSDEEESSSSGAQSYNEISLVDTENLTHTPMVVGFNPRGVQFTADSVSAVVASDAYVAVIDLTAASPAPMRIAISEDLIDPPLAEEVLLTPDGRFAFVRQFGAEELTVIELAEARVERVAVGANPTDLDLTPDGLRAVAVARDAKELWLYDLADPFAEAAVVALPPTESFGSVVMSPDGSRGLLFSTATQTSRYASWELATDEITVRSLVKPVRAIGLSPTGETALVFHPKDNGDTPSTSAFYNHWALTMIDLTDDFFANPLLLPDEPIGFAHSDDGERGYFIMEDQPWLEVLEYQTLLYEDIALKSNPVHVGVVPESTLAWASQEHDLGRLSFYDPDSGDLQTITGFELNSGIEY